MGQKVSSPEQAGGSSTPRNGSCCGAPSSHRDRPTKSKDLIVVSLGSGAADAEQGELSSLDAAAPQGEEPSNHDSAAASVATPQEEPEVVILRKKPQRPQSWFGCGIGVASGPEVEVSDVRPRRALVSWSLPRGKIPRKFHVDVLRLPPDSGKKGPGRKDEQCPEVAFFEADGTASSFELPNGTLDRASGPYRVEVIMESGTSERPVLSHPGYSAAFLTPAEPPGQVVGLELTTDPGEREFQVQWAAPSDDGGSPVEEYEVVLYPPPCAEAGPEGATDEREDSEAAEARESTGSPAEALAADASPASVATAAPPRSCCTRAPCQAFADLPPGSGPYRVEVRVKSAAGLLGSPASLVVSTAVAAPAVPTTLRARLLPRWPYSSDGSLTPRSSVEEVSASDVDIVRLEFRAPLEDGGRPLESYLIYTTEESEEPGAQKPSSRAPVCAVAASDAAGPGGWLPACPCACDVAVEPNRVYTFSVEASNGLLRSGQGEPAPCVFVPARVPLPPSAPPEAFRVEGGFAAELRWVSAINGGGLPLLSFKVGVLRPIADDNAGADADDLLEVGDVEREVTVSCASAAHAVRDRQGGIAWTPPVQVGPHEALYGARVEGLQASAEYRFVLAASNAVGTGRWSRPSSPVWTPMAAPAGPVNAVATVTVDRSQRVMVTVTWECGRGQEGSGSVIAFHVMLVPTQVPAAGSSSDTVVRERVMASGAVPGRRVSWASPLSQPGHYMVEIVAENSAGQRSPPAVLSLDVRPEAFPLQGPERAPVAPRWAEEPVLVLGPTAAGESSFGDFDPGTWLQALLLWHDGDTNPFSASAVTRASSGSVSLLIDVVCCFRRPGSGDAHVATLATGVTASRLQVALPAHVPMSLRLAVRSDPVSSSGAERAARSGERRAAKVQSEPLLLLMSEGSEHLKPVWEVWSRNSPDGQPPRWRELPDVLQTFLEASWLEGHPKAILDVQPGMEGDTGALAPGRYEMTFGDERQVQHVFRRVGQANWSAKARRTVRDNEGEDAALPSIAAEDQCVVCMERRRTHAFMHADTGDGHLALCAACAEAYKAEMTAGNAPRHVRTCPMCRRPFSTVQRIYQ